MPDGDYRKTHREVTEGGLRGYRDAVVGSRSWAYLLYFEFCCWIGILPGALGILLRGLLWPPLFAGCGAGVRFGRGVVLRHPLRMMLGDHVVIAEGAILDARSPGVDIALTIGSHGMLSNYVVLNCKGGTIKLAERIGIGAHSVIQSVNASPVTMGADVIIGPRCYIVGGASYHHDRIDIPINSQGIRPDHGVEISDDVWIGAGAILLGNTRVESGAIIAAGAVVKGLVGKRSIVGGVPAVELGVRGASAEA